MGSEFTDVASTITSPFAVGDTKNFWYQRNVDAMSQSWKEEKEKETNRIYRKCIVMATCVSLLVAAGTSLYLILSSGTEEVETTSQEGFSELSSFPNRPARTSSMKRVRNATTTSLNTTTTTMGKTTTTTIVDPTATTTSKTARTTIVEPTAATTPKATTRTIVEPTATTTSKTTTTRLPWPLPNKTLLCTFGIHSDSWMKGPKEGLCNIIILDYFYNNRTSTFLDRKQVVLQWFLAFVRNDSGSTQFGIGIHHSNALEAYNDLNNAVGMNTFRDFWNLNIRHYALLTFQVHDTLVTKRSTVQDYDKLLKRLRELQEVNRAGAVDKFGYLILGVVLFAPSTSNAYKYLKELLQTAPVDAVIIKTHVDKETFGTACKITGPNVYLRSWNEYGVSMVEALDYVQSQRAQFTRRPLMVSFTMASLQFWVPKTTLPHRYLPGEVCSHYTIDSAYSVCRSNAIYHFNLFPGPHVMLGFHMRQARSITYDTPATINMKICLSTKRYPDLQFGVALFDLELEDGDEWCLQKGHLKEVAGYWRTVGVSSYMKTIRDSNFLSKDPPC